jgi:hypothetical protein
MNIVKMIRGMKVALIFALVLSLSAGELKDKLESITSVVVLVSLIIHYIVLTNYIKKMFFIYFF